MNNAYPSYHYPPVPCTATFASPQACRQPATCAPQEQIPRSERVAIGLQCVAISLDQLEGYVSVLIGENACTAQPAQPSAAPSVCVAHILDCLPEAFETLTKRIDGVRDTIRNRLG